MQRQFLIILFLPLNGAAPMTAAEGMKHLHLYGYVRPDNVVSEVEENTRDTEVDPITMYQRRMGLKETGRLDAATLSEMDKPRCGIRDVEFLRSDTDQKEEWPNWKKKDLTYSIDHADSGMPENETRAAIKAAFAVYSEVIPLTFEEVSSNNADIKIGFTSRDQGDMLPFDGKGGAIAQAQYPRKSGIHFDSDEDWTVMRPGNLPVSTHFDLLTMALHQIGHALGYRNHSPDRKSIMWSQYRDLKDSTTKRYKAPTLDADTINLLQGLYGSIPSTSDGEGCSVGNLYGGFTYPANRFMAFAHSGNQVMIFNTRSKRLIKQANFSEMFPKCGFRGINAAYYDETDSRVMLFYRAWVIL